MSKSLSKFLYIFFNGGERHFRVAHRGIFICSLHYKVVVVSTHSLDLCLWGARVRRVRRGSISSKLLMCGGGVRSILVLPLVARCLETIDIVVVRLSVWSISV